MEGDVRDVKHLADGLIMMIEGGSRVALDDEEKDGALMCVAILLSDRAETVIEQWSAAWKATGGVD